MENVLASDTFRYLVPWIAKKLEVFRILARLDFYLFTCPV